MSQSPTARLLRGVPLLAALLGCDKPPAAPQSQPAPECGGGACCGSPPRPCRELRPECTSRLPCWCPGVVGDPCGAHPDVASCRADERCEGIPYTGESLVPCVGDERCFAKNCPTCGCISRCEVLGQVACERSDGRCAWTAGACKTAKRCGPLPR